MSLAEVAPPGPGELLVVVGPTASGKTDLAVELCERFGAEIISADSVQIYRRFDLGSGKPSAEQRARARHHVVDEVDPLEPIDAAQFAGRAERALADIQARGRRAIVCGGTFLWVKALVWGLCGTAPADAAVRARHLRVAEGDGRSALHAELAAVDPVAAAQLHPNDFVRVSRALEVHELTGRPQSSWHERHGFREPRYRTRFIGVHRDRAELDARIARRTRSWLERGWVDEVRRLRELGYSGARAMGSVGYKQIAEHLDGAIAQADLEQAIVRATRVFVRRQRTWLRDQPVDWLAPG